MAGAEVLGVRGRQRSAAVAGPLPVGLWSAPGMRNRTLVRTAVVLAGVAVATVACGPGRTGGAAAPRPSHARPTATVTSATPTPPPTPKPTPKPTAKDGRHVERCADARCEVLIKHSVHLPLSDFGYVEVLLKPMSGHQTSFQIVHDNGAGEGGWVGGTADFSLDKVKIHLTPVGKNVIVRVSHGRSRDQDEISSTDGLQMTS